MTATTPLPALLPELLQLVQPVGLFFAALGLIVLGLRLVYVLGSAVTTSVRTMFTGSEHSPSPRAEHRAVAAARRAGAEDMRTAWLQWHLRPRTTHTAVSELASLPRTLAVVPRADWSVDRFREHGADVWAVRPLAVTPAWRQKADARLDWMAAMVSDLAENPFDSARGQTSEQYLYHQDREVRDAYLQGGTEAAERIMETITDARDRVRQDAATEGAAAFLAQQRNAAFDRLRSTYRPTKTRDAHAAWDAAAEDLGR
ncbi:hypothetical protein AVL61_13460 [Kocuria rosea subsp. polaris]|uniref:Uncharacterized protein n=1 Tax=Kocuria rosea subsp. polaris TaxID=136273 RepID=A0A0W8I3V6_KOCRO|nr:hypothetical protein [Kocuria polaris]KUG52565.1 hypothetical protein AVL61_13460 [Kocuria polaris]